MAAAAPASSANPGPAASSSSPTGGPATVATCWAVTYAAKPPARCAGPALASSVWAAGL